MKCSKCSSIIPDDSQFCPDCGELIKNISKIRQSANNLVLSNKYGYEKVVDEGLIPQFSKYLSIEGYEKILSFSDKIIKLQKEFDYEQSEERKREKRHQEELRRKNEARLKEEKRRLESLRHEVKLLYSSYTEGYHYAVSHIRIPDYTTGLSIEQCEKILRQKDYIIEKQKYTEKIEKKYDFWGRIIVGLLLKNPAISFSILLVLAPIQAFTSVDIYGFSLFSLSPGVSLWLLIYGILCLIDFILAVADKNN